jgi:uncharacterized membrane protein YhiD involved in acid resistance
MVTMRGFDTAAARIAAVLLGVLVVASPVFVQARDGQAPVAQAAPLAGVSSEALQGALQQVTLALTRLPLAAALGAVLALRPRRRGTPVRTPAVVETQIVLAGIGAIIMLVVGASLARAFGIVGAANLIRYRSKVDDPKDAVVMLGTLAVGLASGVGLYLLAVLATAFLLALLWTIESFEPRVYKRFELTITADGQAEPLGQRVEELLKKHRLRFEVRGLSGDQLSYDVQLPLERPTDPISREIVALMAKKNIAVQWDEKKTKTK